MTQRKSSRVNRKYKTKYRIRNWRAYELGLRSRGDVTIWLSEEAQNESGYRQQARVENGFFRYKSVLGGGLKARNSIAQTREAMIGCHILNRMAELGRPESYVVVS